ncbi:MAG: hypothetical protein AAF488_09875 [Planctomycetota bacterium]
MLILSAFGLTSCSEEELWGNGSGARAETTTPSGMQRESVMIDFSLAHSRTTSNDVVVFYSLDGGAFLEATAVDGTATEDLTVSDDGSSHTFVWDSATDLGGGRFDNIRIRISPVSGRSSTTDSFAVHNSLFLLAVLDTDEGDGLVSLHDVDVTSGDTEHLQTLSTAGDTPRGVMYHDRHYIIANQGSDDISILQLSTSSRTVSEVTDSPFTSGGASPEYFALDDDLLFVANTEAGTITVHEIEGGSGDEDDDTDDEPLSLTWLSDATVDVPGVRSMLVRSGILYAASETESRIYVFDIDDDELVANENSPFESEGLSSPRAIARVGAYLISPSMSASQVAVFRFLGGGELGELGSSPFIVNTGAISWVAPYSTNRFFYAAGLSSFGVSDVTSGGAVSENEVSPVAAGGTVRSVVTASEIVVVGNAGTEEFELYRQDEDGVLTSAGGAEAQGPVRAMAVSEE